MDNINPESRFNTIARHNTQAESSERPESQQSKIDLSIESTAPTIRPSYSKMFDDTELERLQDNLQSIADMAERTLERIKK